MSTKNKRIFICLTDKGGTGKTLFSRILANRLIKDGCNPLLVDGDGEIGGLYQFHKDAMTIRFTGTEKDRDELMSILDSGENTILIDMPAASLTSLIIFNDDVKFFDELKKEGYALTLINVLTPFKSSIRTVKQMIEMTGDAADYIVAVNAVFGDEDDFFLWHGDGHNVPQSKGKTALEKVGGVEIQFKNVQTAVLVALDLNNTSFSDALADDSPLRRVHRSRLQSWLKLMDEELSKIPGVGGVHV